MRPFLNTIGYLVLVFPGGALLAPLAWISVHGNPAPLSFLNEHDDFHRFVTRCIMILALGGLWFLLKINSMNSWKAVGMGPLLGRRSHLYWSFAAGLGSFIILATIGATTTSMAWETAKPITEWLHHFKNALLAMVLVSLIEELLFRGVLFGGMRHSLNWRWAAALASVVFSLVHFLNAKQPNPDSISLATGLTFLPSMLHGPAGDPFWAARFINLFLAGMVLCGLYQNSGNLYSSMAVHGGWILGGKTAVMATQYSGKRELFTPLQSALWGHNEFIEGWAMTPILLGLVIWVFVYQRDESDPILRGHDNAFIN
jgi:membrane protease YdiL (CAAX protease family)